MVCNGNPLKSFSLAISHSQVSFPRINAVRCYRHCSNEYNLRAKLEDLMEIEKKRSGKDYAKADAPMTLNDAGRLLNASIQVMRMLGWAWRWAEWWVDYNSSWEPLLEPWQTEENMTKEELKIVESTRESRCEDARRCRLAAFGAALRNRQYDDEDGFKDRALERALRAVLHTKSLVGPLSSFEIDFYVDWLGRAYRSKSRLLYFGDDKNLVSNDHEFCIYPNKSPKHELGERPLPGEQDLPEGLVFEKNISDVDNFLQTVLLNDLPITASSSKPSRSSSRRKRKADSIDENETDSLVVDGGVPSSPRSTPRSRKSDLIDETDMMNFQFSVLSTPKSKRKRTKPLNALEKDVSPVKPPSSGKRRGRPPNSTKKAMIANSPENVNVESEKYSESTMLLDGTFPMATESLLRPLNKEQEVEQSHRASSSTASLIGNVGLKPADQDEAQKPADHGEKEVPPANTGLPHHEMDVEMAADVASSVEKPVDADPGLSTLVTNTCTLNGSDEMPNTNNSAAMADQSALAPEIHSPGAGSDAALANESETLAVLSPSRSRVRFRSKLRGHVRTDNLPHSHSEPRQDTAHSPAAEPAPSFDEGLDKFEVVKKRQRRPTRPLTYDHPETYQSRRAYQSVHRYDDSYDDDLPLTELALQYPGLRNRARRHATRKQDIGVPEWTPVGDNTPCDDVAVAMDPSIGTTEVTVSKPERSVALTDSAEQIATDVAEPTNDSATRRSDRSQLPRIRGRRRGKIQAAEAL
jgi:hypothetical protein